jgi:hypothetical protein
LLAGPAKRDQNLTIGEAVLDAVRHMHRERGLAEPALTGQGADGDGAASGEVRLQPVAVGGAAGEVGQVRGELAAGVGGGSGVRVRAVAGDAPDQAADALRVDPGAEIHPGAVLEEE